MALTCSVLGHAYGDPTVERDREERGSEVVVTIREYETCTRCGTSRVVSENKEVTAVEAEADDAEPVTERTTDLDAPAAQSGAPRADAAESGTPADVDEPAASGEDDADEGAEILDAEAEAPVDDEPVDEELASPSVADEPAEVAESEPEDDGVVISGDERRDSGADEERAPGEWPEEDDGDDDPEWAPPNVSEEPSTPEPESTTGPTVTVPEGEFHCDECGYTTPVESSSLRAGDFCPECHRGSLTHVRDT